MKQKLLHQVINLLEDDLKILRLSAAETHRSSTGDESKQEGKYDTRGLEASYLAEAQADKVRQLEESLHKLNSLVLKDDPDSVISGALVIVSSSETDLDSQFFILPAGGGITLDYEGEPLIVITPGSPIGSALLGESIGDVVHTEQLGEIFISEIY